MAVDGVLFYGLRVFGTTVLGGVSLWASGSGFSADCICGAVDGVLFDKLRVFVTSSASSERPSRAASDQQRLQRRLHVQGCRRRALLRAQRLRHGRLGRRLAAGERQWL